MNDLQRVEALLAPLLDTPSAPLPPGKDLREDPGYAVVSAEVAKLSQLSASGVDWGRVRGSGEQVLRERAKDLMTVAGVSLSYVAERGTQGLAEGAFLLAETLDRHWDRALPEPARLRGRANAIAWFVERAAPRLADASATATVTSIAEANAAMTRLNDVIVTRFPTSAPSLAVLRDALGKLTPQAADPITPKNEPAVPQSAAAPAPAPVAAAPEPAPALAPTPADVPSDPWAHARRQVEGFLKPVSAERPGGVQARFDPRYEAVRAEAQKIESMTGGKPDWAVVVREGGALLEQISKDILMASYLGFAMGEQGGLAGYVRGTALLAALVDEFWADAFPDLSRIRARKTAIEWFLERAQNVITQMTPKIEEREAAEALVVVVEKLTTVTRARFETDGPSIRGMRDAANRVLASVPVPAPVAPPPPPPPPPGSAPAAAPSSATAAPAAVSLGSAPTAQLGDVAELVPFLQSIGASLVTTARALATARPSDPAAFRLLRAGAYLHMTNLPPNTGGKLNIAPPEQTFRDKLELIRGNGKWLALLAEAEGAIPMQRLYLDLHEHVDASLEGLGPDFAPARSALQAELGSVVRRLKGIAELTYNDGTPLASARTQTFLGKIAGAGGGGGGGAGATSGVPADLVGKARALVAGQKLSEALTVLTQEPLASPKARFEARTLAAELALEGGRADVARAMFDALGEEAEKNALDHWDPALAIRVWAGLAKTSKGDAAPLVERRARALARLARIDPTTVLVLMSP